MVEMRPANGAVGDAFLGGCIVVIAACHEKEIARDEPVRFPPAGKFGANNGRPISGSRGRNIFHLDYGYGPACEGSYCSAEGVAGSEFD